MFSRSLNIVNCHKLCRHYFDPLNVIRPFCLQLMYVVRQTGNGAVVICLSDVDIAIITLGEWSSTDDGVWIACPIGDSYGNEPNALPWRDGLCDRSGVLGVLGESFKHPSISIEHGSTWHRLLRTETSSSQKFQWMSNHCHGASHLLSKATEHLVWVHFAASEHNRMKY